MTEHEYKELVLADFDRKMAGRMLPQELVSTTRRSLKAHSVNICAQRFDPKDKLLLSSFFGAKEDGATYMKVIQISKAEVFRTLNNFLNDRSINTDFNNINLLAWLIDFQPRPYHPDLKPPVVVVPAALTLDLPPSPPFSNDDDNPPPSVRPPQVKKRKKVWPYFFLLILIPLTAYYIMDRKGLLLTGKEGCMFWDEDHYWPLDCKDRSSHVHVYPINHRLVDSFKKITRPDTLSPHSIGKVWYAKFNGRVEFYTLDGPYPGDTNRRVLPMSDRILEKYIYHIKN